MTDRELLEMAAKAGGYWDDFALDEDDQPIFDETRGFQLGFSRGWWNAVNDDGDALRLAVQMGLLVDTHGMHARVCFPYGEPLAYEQMGDNRCAIVRAAAAIGEQT